MDKAAIPHLIIFYAFILLGIFMGQIIGIIAVAVGVMGVAVALFFYRDPSREISQDGDTIVSPADGKIVLIDNVGESTIGEGIRIAIFMSPLNVHVNRIPFGGRVISVSRFPGGFRRAFLPEASLENERVETIISTEHGEILVRQIAGIIARRIVCRISPGEIVTKGQRYGLIHFGSRVELVLPKHAIILVEHGMKVRGGETIVARWR